MTDNEIIQALNVCVGIQNDCSECPLLEYSKASDECMTELMSNALDLIKRKDEQIESLIAGQETLQKYIAEKDAEIERLNAYISRCESGEEYWVKCLLERPAEAVKEFAEKLRREFPVEPMGYSGIGSMYSADGIRSKIDNIKKEMVGE